MSDSGQWLLDRLTSFGEADAIIHGESITTYDALVDAIPQVTMLLDQRGVRARDRVVVIGDFGTMSSAVLLELISRRAVLIPMTLSTAKRRETLFQICAADWCVEVEEGRGIDGVSVQKLVTADAPNSNHQLFRELEARDVPGLVLFTSGSTGEPKAVVHDFSLLLEKFRVNGRPARTVNFLLFDHWGGLNTLLHILTSGGVVACPQNRNPDYICSLIEKHKLELLPASPSFLNLMMVSGAHKNHDLSSLKLITYGSEPMPPTTLARVHRELPNIDLRQTYGLIELGVLRAKSAGSDSLLVKLGGDGYDIRVVDNLLEIKAKSSMLGYLNAPSPFTEDGYFKTGDRVEQHGEYVRILGRESEQINVGGEKVFPTEVETTLLDCPHVADAVVYGVSHPLSGKVVAADVVRIASDLEDSAVRTAIRLHCNERLEPYKVPVKIKFVEGPLVGDRQKRVRIGRDVEEN
jgi:long-chain acyl-CoA synthetase